MPCTPAVAGVGLPDHELIPKSQLRFGEIVDHYWLVSRKERDQARRRSLLVERGKALRAALEGQVTFDRWMCVRYLAAQMKDKTVFTILGVPGPRTEASMGFSNGVRTTTYGTSIEANSAIGAALLALPDRDAFLASGSFVPDGEGDLVDSLGLGQRDTDEREFKSPGFLVRLAAVEQPAWLQDLSADRKKR